MHIIKSIMYIYVYIIYMYIHYLYIYFFYSKLDIFIMLLLGIFMVFAKLITLVAIATCLAYQFSWFLQLSSSGVGYTILLQQLLKHKL